MSEEHLDLFALSPRLLEGFGASQRPGQIAGSFIEAARYLAGWRIGAATRLELALAAVQRAAAIEKRGAVIDEGAGGAQRLVAWADVGIGILVVLEVRRGKVPSLRVDLSITGT